MEVIAFFAVYNATIENLEFKIFYRLKEYIYFLLCGALFSYRLSNLELRLHMHVERTPRWIDETVGAHATRKSSWNLCEVNLPFHNRGSIGELSPHYTCVPFTFVHPDDRNTAALKLRFFDSFQTE